MKNPHPFRQSFLAILVLGTVLAVNSIASAQEKKTSEKKENVTIIEQPFIEKPQKEDPEYLLGILLEYFTVDLRTANRLTRAHAPKAADAKELRDKLEHLIDQGSAELRETVWLSARGGQRAKNESIREVIYPTGYEQPEIPNVYGVSAATNANEPKQKKVAVQTAAGRSRGSSRVPMTHANPALFKTRNVGVTLEVDPVFTKNHQFVHMNLAPEIVTHLGYEYFTRDGREDTAYGIDHIRMPLFYKMKFTGVISIVPGNENLLAIHTPPDDPDHRVLVMLRVDLIPVQ